MAGAPHRLLLDPYFSATKIAWLLDHVQGARARAQRGELAFGTIDSWLIWKLTGGRAHVTDATNASRTALFNLAHAGSGTKTCWHSSMYRAHCCRACWTAGRTSASTEPALFGEAIGIGGVAGDQQAATIGQACFAPGMAKSTYGTGCFIVLNTGSELKLSCNRLSAPWHTGSAAGPPSRWRAASSSPARPCSGCATHRT